MALTDHSPRLKIAKGLTAERLRKQLDVVAELNEELAPFRILTGIEVDILEDGDARPGGRAARRARRGRRERALEAAHAGRTDDRPHGDRDVEPARRHPRPLHRAAGHRPWSPRVDVRRRPRVRRVRALRQGGRDQLPARAARPADAPPRHRDGLRLQGVDRHRRPCSRPARVAALRLRRVPPRPRCRSSASSTRGPWTTSSRGPHRTRRPDRREWRDDRPGGTSPSAAHGQGDPVRERPEVRGDVFGPGGRVLRAVEALGPRARDHRRDHRRTGVVPARTAGTAARARRADRTRVRGGPGRHRAVEWERRGLPGDPARHQHRLRPRVPRFGRRRPTARGDLRRGAHARSPTKCGSRGRTAGSSGASRSCGVSRWSCDRRRASSSS